MIWGRRLAREIEGTSKAQAIMGRWAPNELAFIQRLDLGPGLSSDASAALRIVALFQRHGVAGWPSVDEPMYRVTLLFDGVQGLVLKDFGSADVQIMGFDIRSLADRGWEGLSFEIEDYEDDRIRFYCDRVQILEVEAGEEFSS